ncbi:hypothetical protein GCM10009000_111840 [Halobacterium noricense]
MEVERILPGTVVERAYPLLVVVVFQTRPLVLSEYEVGFDAPVDGRGRGVLVFDCQGALVVDGRRFIERGEWAAVALLPLRDGESPFDIRSPLGGEGGFL